MEKIEKPFQTTDNTLHMEPRSREDLERREAKEAAWQKHFKEECTENGAHCAATEECWHRGRNCEVSKAMRLNSSPTSRFVGFCESFCCV